MDYIKNEINRCETGLQEKSAEKYSFLYCVQQALKWAKDPLSYASPVDIILTDKVGIKDTQGDLASCSVVRRPLPSSDTCAQNDLPPQQH